MSKTGQSFYKAQIILKRQVTRLESKQQHPLRTKSGRFLLLKAGNTDSSAWNFRTGTKAQSNRLKHETKMSARARKKLKSSNFWPNFLYFWLLD